MQVATPARSPQPDFHGNSPEVLQRQVEDFWNAQPCNSDLSSEPKRTKDYFLDIERARYSLEDHIPEVLGLVNWDGKRVLEIGAGVGTDARNIIARGGIYTGINIDAGSTQMARSSLQAFDLPGTVLQCDATQMDFPAASFDVVYSFGVLLCIPQIDRAVAQIARVLRPGGEVLVMLYNRSSINYQIEIKLLRRALRRSLTVPGAIPLLAAAGLPRQKLLRHAQLLTERPNMSEEEWLSRNTDGPDNPYATVYSADEAARLFSGWKILSNQVRFFDYRHWGVAGRTLPLAARHWLGKRWGWHRIVHARRP